MSAPEVGLTEAERADLGERVCWHCYDRNPWEVAARIKADAKTAERERIAQAIEAENDSFGVSDDPYGGEYDRGVHQGLHDAARIARDGGVSHVRV